MTIQEQINLLDYIDFQSICEDFNLETGDITPNQANILEEILTKFIEQNK